MTTANFARNEAALDATPDAAPEVVVLGLGNLLRRDEGLGVCALERLDRRYAPPPGVRFVDGGVLGLELLAYVERTRRLLVLDATLTGGQPGDLLRLEDDQAPAYFGMRSSSHEIGLPDLLAVARLQGHSPESVVILGMQPEIIELGWDLSAAVSSHLDDLVAAAVEQLAAWGYPLQRRAYPAESPDGEERIHA